MTTSLPMLTRWIFSSWATEAQKTILEQQFQHYSNKQPKIVTIPVGSLDQLTYPKDPRKPFSMITASRLATEKHIDWLVAATVQAQAQLPETDS